MIPFADDDRAADAANGLGRSDDAATRLGKLFDGLNAINSA